MDAQKLGIVALVVIVVIFAITLGLGASHGDSGDSDDKDPVEFLEGLKSERFVEIGNKAGTTCAQSGDELGVTGQCGITIEKRGFLNKPTRVALEGASGLLTVRVDQDAGPDSEDLIAGDDCFETAVAAKGGTITLIGQVSVDLRGEQCPEEED